MLVSECNCAHCVCFVIKLEMPNRFEYLVEPHIGSRDISISVHSVERSLDIRGLEVLVKLDLISLIEVNGEVSREILDYLKSMLHSVKSL